MRLLEKATAAPSFVKKDEGPQWDKAQKKAAETPDKDQESLAKQIFLKSVGREETDEAATSGANGALMRPSKIKRECREQNYRQFKISEKTKDGSGKDYYPVIIIAQGMGNLKDKNYYTAEAIQSGEAIYEGKKCYFDHPTEDEERARPGRSVREIAGHYEEVTAQKINGLMCLKAKLCPVPEEKVTKLLDHAVEYKKKYPDKDFIGISINGDGEGVTMEYEDFIKEIKPSREEMDKISEIEGQSINVITKLTEAVSADLVTEAGARGQILKENKKQIKKEKKMRFIESMRKLLSGAEVGNKELMEKAVKDMIQDEDDKSEKKEGDEGSKVEKEAAGLVKHMLQAKKDLKKDDDETDEAYEMKCMKQAMQKHEDEKSSEKKEADDKKKKDDGDGDDDSKEKKEKSDKEADEKKEAGDDDKKKDAPAPKDGGDDKGDKKDKGDEDPMKKMMGELESLKKEIESLKKEKKESDKEAKDAKESAAEAIIALKVKQRAESIDKVLRESGLPRTITDVLRPVVERCKTDKEMKETVAKLAESHSKALEESFFAMSRGGLVERRADATDSSTDDLFTNKGDN